MLKTSKNLPAAPDINFTNKSNKFLQNLVTSIFINYLVCISINVSSSLSSLRFSILNRLSSKTVDAMIKLNDEYADLYKKGKIPDIDDVVKTLKLDASTAGNATVNTGGGGGGSGEASSTAGAGGSGIVLIRRLTACSCSTDGNAVLTCGSDTIHVFTGDGTFTP